jgi:spore coat protein CotF
MDINERIQNLSARISTTTDPALREELQKELQELLNQMFSKKERVLKRDDKGRFTGE